MTDPDLPVPDLPVPDLPVPDLRSAFDYAPIGMAVLTPTGVVIMGNTALGDLLGRPTAALVGTTLFEVTHPDDLAEARRNCDLIQSGTQRILRHECRFLRADGTPVWVLVSTARVPRSARHPEHLIMHIEDIDERKQLEAELTHRALHDPLTGLANRTLLTQRLEEALTGDDSDPRPTCLLYVDLDGFKAVNDRHGHSVGDRLLQLVAERLRSVLRSDDVCARIGGDEFAVLCLDTHPQEADDIADRLRGVIDEPFVIDGVEVGITAAVGVGASSTGQTHTWRTLITDADAQMYRNKRRSVTP